MILLFISALGSVVTILGGMVAMTRWILRGVDKRIEEGVTTELRDHMAEEDKSLKKQRKHQRALERDLTHVKATLDSLDVEGMQKTLVRTNDTLTAHMARDDETTKAASAALQAGQAELLGAVKEASAAADRRLTALEASHPTT